MVDTAFRVVILPRCVGVGVSQKGVTVTAPFAPVAPAVTAVLAGTKSKGGGDFYRTAKVRLGKRFIREVVASTLEGKTLYSEAFELLGTKKTSVFDGLAERFVRGGGE